MVSIAEFSKPVGGMQFACGVLLWDKPFLAPLYTLMSLSPTDAVVVFLGFVKAAMRWLKSRFEIRRTVPCG
eukprot:3434719-Lingulodinium_polyedra.AAC.1